MVIVHMEPRDDPAAAAARLCRSRSARCKTIAAAVQRWRRAMALRRRACDCTSCALDSRLSRSYDARFADARPSWPRYLACTHVAARPSCLLLAAAATLRSCSACERARRPRWHAAMTVAENDMQEKIIASAVEAFSNIVFAVDIAEDASRTEAAVKL